MVNKLVVTLILLFLTVGIFSLTYVEAQSKDCDTCAYMKEILKALNQIGKEEPVIYAKRDLIRDRVVLNSGFGDALGLKEEFLPLPNGACNVTVASSTAGPSTPPHQIQIMEAKDAIITRNSKACTPYTFSCSHNVNIDNEYYMIKITSDERVGHLSVSYQCIRS